MWFGLVALNRLGSVWRVGFPPHVCLSAHLDLKPGAMAPVPKHFLGDASSCRARAVYNGHQVETQSLLSDQAIAVEMQQLQDRCLACASAVEANGAITAVKLFTMHGNNLQRVNAEDSLIKLHSLHLPNERLACNTPHIRSHASPISCSPIRPPLDPPSPT
mmetsp:Transcript_42447/g.95925  ORF Transcript_42447/g.95925 Transcript_42447/m.95925 type:complete len:161 (-) Transcript_42447:457-939(-)